MSVFSNYWIKNIIDSFAQRKLKITFEFVIFVNVSKCIVINFINKWIFCRYFKIVQKIIYKVYHWFICQQTKKYRVRFYIDDNQSFDKNDKICICDQKNRCRWIDECFFWRNNFALWHVRWHCQRSKFCVHQCFLIFFIFSRKNTQTFQYRFSFSNK